MIEQTSDTWRIVESHALQRIEKLRGELEKESTTPEKTTYMRGQINALRSILALKEKAP